MQMGEHRGGGAIKILLIILFTLIICYLFTIGVPYEKFESYRFVKLLWLNILELFSFFGKPSATKIVLLVGALLIIREILK